MSVPQELKKTKKKTKKKIKKKKKPKKAKKKYPKPTYTKAGVNYSSKAKQRAEDPRLMEELYELDQTWNKIDLREKLRASLSQSKLATGNSKSKSKKFEKFYNENPAKARSKNQFRLRKTSKHKGRGLTSSMPRLKSNTIKWKSQAELNYIPEHVKRKIKHDFKKRKKAVYRQNHIHVSKNFHSNLRLTLEELGDIQKTRRTQPTSLHEHLLYSNPNALIQEHEEDRVPIYEAGFSPVNRPVIPPEERSTRPIFLVRRPMSSKFNPIRTGFIEGTKRNMRECDLWSFKKIKKTGFLQGKDKIKRKNVEDDVRPGSVFHMPKNRCVGLCDIYCGLREDRCCKRRCGAGEIGRAKSDKIYSHQVSVE
jgi:hypothetical protein